MRFYKLVFLNPKLQNRRTSYHLPNSQPVGRGALGLFTASFNYFAYGRPLYQNVAIIASKHMQLQILIVNSTNVTCISASWQP